MGMIKGTASPADVEKLEAYARQIRLALSGIDELVTTSATSSVCRSPNGSQQAPSGQNRPSRVPPSRSACIPAP